MSVFKRKGTPYYYAEFQIDGHRFCGSTKTTTRREALAVEKTMREAARKKIRDGSREHLTLDQAFQLFWEEEGSRNAPKWARETDRYIAEILSRVNPNLMVEDMTDAHVNEFVQSRRRDGAGNYATNRALSIWRQMHNRARKVWKQKTEVIDWADFMSPESKRVRSLTYDELRKVLNHLPDHIGLAVEWSVYAGTREEATFSLRWSNVFIDRGYVNVKEKGKTKFRVWLSPQAIDVLMRAKAIGHPAGLRRRTYARKSEPSEDLVFCSRNRRRVWESALKSAGIEDFRWHDLRHTFATWMRQAGAPIEVVQRALGHADIATTLRYAHVVDNELQEALHRMPSFAPQSNVVSLVAAKPRS